MAYHIPSYRVKPPVGGQRRDLPIYSIPEDAAYELRNFVRRNGLVQSRPGYVTMGSTLGDRPTGVFLFPHHSGNFKLVVATESGWYDWSGSAWTDRTEVGNGLTGAVDSFQLFRVFYKNNISYLVGVNGHTDAPKQWNGTADDYSDVGGSPGNPKVIGVLFNRMLMANFVDAPVKVDVSSFNDFEAGWGSTQVVNLYDTPGEIVAFQEMGNLVGFFYKTDSIYSCVAAAALDPFKFELKKARISGPVSPAAVVPTPWGNHLIMAIDFNVYSWDGSGYIPIGDHVRTHIKTAMNLDKASLSWGFYDMASDEVWFFFPPVGEDTCRAAVAIKRDGTVWPQLFDAEFYPTAGAQVGYTNKITIGDMVNTLGTYTNPLSSYTSYQNFQVLGGSTGQMYMQQGNGCSLVKYQTGVYAPSEKLNYVTVGEIDVYTKRTGGAQNVNVSLMHSEDGGLNLLSESPQTINLGEEGPHELGERRTSRYFGIKMETTSTLVEKVQLETVKVSGVERGPR